MPICPHSRFRLAQSLINVITSQIESTDRWADFNPDHSLFEYQEKLAAIGLICDEDVQDKPKIDDYRDKDLPRTKPTKTSLK